MIRRPLSSLKLKQADIEQMERELEKKRQARTAEDTVQMEMDTKPDAEALARITSKKTQSSN